MRRRLLAVARRLLLVPALGLSWCAQSIAQTAAEHYEQALVAYNLGEIRTAHIHLRNALKEDPFLLTAHLLLAKIHLALGDGAEAEQALRVADGLGAHRSLVLVPLARAYLLQGKAQRLVGELFPIGVAPEEDSELLSLRGQAHLQLGQIYDAERAFEQAWERAPRSVPALIGRAQTRLLRGALEEARVDVERAVVLAPENAQAWYLKAMIERDLGDLQVALEDFERAVAVEPAHLPAQIGRVGVLVDLDRAEEAAQVIAKVRETYPRDPRVYYLEAVVSNLRGEEAAAERALLEGEAIIGKLPKALVEGHSPTLLLAGMISFSLKKWEQASSYLEVYIKRHPEEVGPRKLLAQIFLDWDRYESALALLEPALDRSAADPGLLSLLAEAYMRDGRYIKASLLLDEAMSLDVDDLTLRTQHAVNAFFLGRRGQAIEQLGSIFSSWPDLDSAGSMLVVMLMQRGQPERAAVVADEVVARHPDNLSHLNLQGVAHFASGDAERARESFLAALQIDPRFLPAQLNLAKMDLSAGIPADAQARLEAILEDHPDHVPAMLELARALEAQGEDAEAIRWARRALAEDPDSARVAVYLIDLLLKTKQPEEALRVGEGMEVRAPEDVEVLAALGRAYLANGQRSTAQVVLQRTSGLAGYDARMLLRIAMLQQQAGDLDGAVWSLQKAVDGEPEFLPGRLRLGEFLASIGRIEKAALVARALKRDYPDDAYGYHLAGIIERRTGDYRAALESFSAALRRNRSPVLAVRVYEMKQLIEGGDAALAFLEGWLEDHPDDALVRQSLAEAYFRNERWDEARALYEQSLADHPDNPLVMNNLALIYARDGDPRAQELARRAHELLPGVPEIGDTLGWILVQQGRTLEGLKHLRDAQSRAAADPGIRYHIAVALTELERRAEARAELEKALRGSAEFPERDAAQALLARLREDAGG